MSPETAYADLIRLSKQQSLIASCSNLLEWDEETYMPRGGVRHRSEQSVVLAGLLHERRTHPGVGELLAAVEGSALVRDPDSPGAVNVRELRREYQRLVRLPRALVEEKARVTTLAQRAWVEAREEGDYGRAAPWLNQIVGLCREEAQAIGGGACLYDVLLEQYEPGVTSAQLKVLFKSLRDALTPLVQAVGASRKRPRRAVLEREFPVERQKLFAQAVCAGLGFDLERGRLDVAAHPFCISIGAGDIRLTARYSERNLADGFFATLHEVGHGLYEQGLDAAHFGTPMGQPASLGVHESQSRLWENFVGRGLPFWEHFFPRARNVFPEALAGVKLEAFHQSINRVAPTLIRAQADELTYNLHILVRFELEQALLSGDLGADDLPGAWREAYRTHLGIEPANDAEGCLQDGHWAEGLIGYFPTYTLGNVYAAQFFAAARAAIPDLDGSFAKGDFSPLLGWLREHVHRNGQRFRAAELVRLACGSEPDHRPLIETLTRKCTT